MLITDPQADRSGHSMATGAFGSGLGGLLRRPKPDDIELVNSQHRLEPFWHAGGRALYVYDRARLPGQALMAKVQGVVTRDALFDIGADTVSLLVPGGGVAVTVARLAIDRNQKS